MSKPVTHPGADASDRNIADDQLQAVLAAAALREPIQRGEDGREWLIVPPGFRAEDVTDPNRHPTKPAAAQITVDYRASLVAYTNRHQHKDCSTIFADYDTGTITARLDWHPHNNSLGPIGDSFPAAGPDRHRVTLKLRPSKEWARWNGAAGKMHPQATFARFLEENATDILLPEPAIFIELARDMEAVADRSFTSRTRLSNGDSEFRFSEDSRVVGTVTVPESFTLRIPLYQGEAPEDLRALFRWKADKEGLTFGFVWHRAEYMRQARFQQIAAQAADETGLPYILGRVTG